MKKSNKSIRDKWNAYIENITKDSIRSDWGPLGLNFGPFFLEEPCCITCKHWHLIEENHFGIFHGVERDIVVSRFEDAKNSEFLGFCKRFPPLARNSCYPIRQGLFKMISVIKPSRVSSFDFPVLEQSNMCGEWSEVEWLKTYKNHYEKLKSEMDKCKIHFGEWSNFDWLKAYDDALEKLKS